MIASERAGSPGCHQRPNSDAAASATRPPAITRSICTRDAMGGGRFIQPNYKRLHYAVGMKKAFVLALAASLSALPAAAQDRTVALLQQLTDTAGPPGFEEPIRKVM